MTRPTILIIDDIPQNLLVLGEVLGDLYHVRAATNGARALEMASQRPLPDLILLDVMMPDMDGYEVLTRLRELPLTREIPVIFTTAMSHTEDEERGFALGAADYLSKPLRPSILLARIQSRLELKRVHDTLRDDKTMLQREVAGSQRENLLIQDVSIRALARLAETRDNETGQHILRTAGYVATLARLASQHPRFALELTEANIALIAKSAPLHDIGKVGIPDHVLLKPGKLTPPEWIVMKSHARLGAEAIERAVADTCQQVPFLTYAAQIALHHHERWNGSGYPDGLAGDAIPLAARLMAIADVFDALISRRVYKAAMPFAEARSLMAEEAGKHFDPDLLQTFLEHFEAFCEIARSLPDEPDDRHGSDSLLEEPVPARPAFDMPAMAV